MSFDAASFLNQTIDGELSTQRTPVPEGEYVARIGSDEKAIGIEPITGRKDPTKKYLRATIWWEIVDEGLKAQLKRETIMVRQQWLLDADEQPDGGWVMRTGKEDNTTLGRVLDAVNMNHSGTSLAHIRGAGPARIKVSQRSGEDPKDKYAEVTRVAKL